VLDRLKAAGLEHIPVVVGGIIPPADARALEAAGVARVYTPKDFELNAIVADILDLVHRRLNHLTAPAPAAAHGSAIGQ
jgi:(2R)-ethylmalonyl-CoA mutase